MRTVLTEHQEYRIKNENNKDKITTNILHLFGLAWTKLGVLKLARESADNIKQFIAKKSLRVLMSQLKWLNKFSNPPYLHIYEFFYYY